MTEKEELLSTLFQILYRKTCQFHCIIKSPNNTKQCGTDMSPDIISKIIKVSDKNEKFAKWSIKGV